MHIIPPFKTIQSSYNGITSPVGCQATVEAGLSLSGGNLGVRDNSCWAGPSVWDSAPQCLGQDELSGVVRVMSLLTRQGVK